MSTHLSNIEGMEMAGKLPEVRLANTPFKVVSPFEPSGDQPEAIAALAKGVEEGLRYQTLLGVTGSGKTFTMAKTIDVSPFEPSGDQPEAIAALAKGVEEGLRYQTLLGVTGSGKTFTMAKTIEAVQKPTLVMAPNKTLAAQLAAELKEFFPDNAVVYFVSYYDYYQPEAYVPSKDLYIEKDSAINQEIDRLRHSATAALFARRDVVIVASVSCIFGLGSPEVYDENLQTLRLGEYIDRDALLRKLVSIQYTRNDTALGRGTFRVRGETLEIFPAYAETAFRIVLFGDEVEHLQHFDPVTGEILEDNLEHVGIWPASHYNVREGMIEDAVAEIGRELNERCAEPAGRPSRMRE